MINYLISGSYDDVDCYSMLKIYYLLFLKEKVIPDKVIEKICDSFPHLLSLFTQYCKLLI